MITEKKHKQKKKNYNITYTTGDIDLNIAHFNKCMGTDFSKEDLVSEDSDISNETAQDSTASAESLGENIKLSEAKRIVKRYYIRPQNIFCSNKSDILKTLAEIGDANCSVYSLKNLEDHDDIHKLTTNDIIYYYDNNVLYDKNYVQILDYDLSVKNEEQRKKFAGEIEDVSDETFIKAYDDRLTDRTADLEESYNPYLAGYGIEFKPANRRNVYNSEKTALNVFEKLKELVAEAPYHYNPKYTVTVYKMVDEKKAEIIDSFCAGDFLDKILSNNPDKKEDNDFDPFKLYFDPVNVYGESISLEESKSNICCICGEEIDGHGNNPAPYKENGKCCDACNTKFVIPARVAELNTKTDGED